MSIFNVISLLGGLAMFLYGMTVMSSGLERVSGGRLEQTLEKMTDNVLKATLLGLAVTAAIQSSSATTVIVVGLVNAKILKLRQAIGIIMGANIGTTVTAHILRLSEIEGGTGLNLLNFLKPTTLAPLTAIVGILMYMMSKRTARRELGQILVGFSILFTGMFAMEAAVSPLREAPQFAAMFANLSNPILGVLVGAGVTAIIQSSSASIGILQALTVTGAITASSAFPIIMGQNIGTCITPVLSSIGASKNARRTAFVHVSFNVIGTLIFLTGIYAYQTLVGFSFWDDPITKGGIADFHTLFNVVVTLLFLPFTTVLEKLVFFFIKPTEQEKEQDADTDDLDDLFLGSPSFAISHARGAVVKMSHLALDNFQRSAQLLHHQDKKTLERAREVEDVIDRLQSRVDSYLLRLTQNELTESENTTLAEVLQVVNEFERIGDHADNICDLSHSMEQKGVTLSDSAMAELDATTEAVSEIIRLAVKGYEDRDVSVVNSIEPLEEVIDILVETLKARHNERLRNGLCTIDSAFPFLEILYNLERIADHCSNIGVHIVSYSGTGEVQDRHEFLREIHRSQTAAYKTNFDMYDKKYFDRIMEIAQD